MKTNLEKLSVRCGERGWTLHIDRDGWFVMSRHAMLSHITEPRTFVGDKEAAGTPYPRGYGSGSFDELMEVFRVVEECTERDGT